MNIEIFIKAFDYCPRKETGELVRRPYINTYTITTFRYEISDEFAISHTSKMDEIIYCDDGPGKWDEYETADE